MDTKLKKDWVAALRSGRYEQGKFNLRTKENKYCCLGVLCDVINSDKWTKDYIQEDIFCWKGDSGKTEITSGLSTYYMEEIGLDEIEHNTLINQNDSENKTFSEIADYIEKNI